MNRPEDRHFTDFEGRLRARLAAVIPAKFVATDAKTAPTTAKYDCRVKVEYQKDLMRLVEEGMLIAVPNFKSQGDTSKRYTLMEISRVSPEHYGLRGLSDHSYYPLQFEIIDQSVADWRSDDASTMMVQISAIPTNYDFLIEGDEEPEFIKGFSYPVVGEKAVILNKETINHLYNRRIIDKLQMKFHKKDALGQQLGIIKMFESDPDKIPIYVDFENLVRYHFGVFAFTGGGKSNLLSNILRKVIRHTNDIKVVIFDISVEYPFLLLDLFADRSISSKIVLDEPVSDTEQFYSSIVKPRDFENDHRVRAKLDEVLRQRKVTHYVKPRFRIPTYANFLDDIESQRGDESNRKPNYQEALDQITQAVLDYVSLKKKPENQEIDEDFVSYIHVQSSKIVQDLRVHDKSSLFAWATTREQLLRTITKMKSQKTSGTGLTFEQVCDELESDTRLFSLSIADEYNIKELAVKLSGEFLRTRKREFKVKPYVLFVFDEAQEFALNLSDARGIDRECTESVETLLRQGRKYGLGGCLATQRIAYLNTSSLQQLHTYFVGTLPRYYDRTVVSGSFIIDMSILDKTLEFAPGEWLLSSYIATGIENVPIFICAENTEAELEKFLSS